MVLADYYENHGGDPNIVDSNGTTRLHSALQRPGFRKDRSRFLRMLLEHGADLQRLLMSAPSNPLEACRFPPEMSVLLDAGADINTRYRDGTPLLMDCIMQTSLSLCKFLIQRGADVTLPGLDRIEEEIDRMIDDREDLENDELWDTLELFTDVRDAGGFRRYMNAPRVELVLLRALCARGRARPPTARREPVLARLFAAEPPPASSTKKAAGLMSRRLQPLPNEIFWLILSFWRTSRDDDWDVDYMAIDGSGWSSDFDRACDSPGEESDDSDSDRTRHPDSD
jgi:hypothetical protein